MKNFKAFCLIIVLHLVSVSSFARDICHDLFAIESGKTVTHRDLFHKIRESEKDQLIGQVAKNLRLQNSKFSVHNKNLYYDLGNGRKIKAAEIQILYPEYVFEYQDKSYHEYWIENGINKADMNLIIDSQGQTYGRGYYVSLSATDSYNFGNYLTVFKIAKPLILLEANYDSYSTKNLIFEDPATIRQLAEAGIAGVRGTTTWISIFNESYLDQADVLNSESLLYSLRLNFDARMQKNLLGVEKNYLTVLAHFQNIKNVDFKSLQVKNILKKDLSALSELEILILVESLHRSQYYFGMMVTESRYKTNAIVLYALVFHHLKKLNPVLYHQILSVSPQVIAFKNLGLTVPDLIKQVDLLDIKAK